MLYTIIIYGYGTDLSVHHHNWYHLLASNVICGIYLFPSMEGMWWFHYIIWGGVVQLAIHPQSFVFHQHSKSQKSSWDKAACRWKLLLQTLHFRCIIVTIYQKEWLTMCDTTHCLFTFCLPVHAGVRGACI